MSVTEVLDGLRRGWCEWGFEKENLIGLPNLRLANYSTEQSNTDEKAFCGLGGSLLLLLLHSKKLSILVKPSHCAVTASTWYSSLLVTVTVTLRYLLLTEFRPRAINSSPRAIQNLHICDKLRVGLKCLMGEQKVSQCANLMMLDVTNPWITGDCHAKRYNRLVSLFISRSLDLISTAKTLSSRIWTVVSS